MPSIPPPQQLASPARNELGHSREASAGREIQGLPRTRSASSFFTSGAISRFFIPAGMLVSL